MTIDNEKVLTWLVQVFMMVENDAEPVYVPGQVPLSTPEIYKRNGYPTGEFTKRVGELSSQLFVTLHIYNIHIYISLCKQKAETTSPVPFLMNSPVAPQVIYLI